jgi:hypothetical protein
VAVLAAALCGAAVAAAPVVGPQGVGALRLGMTRSASSAYTTGALHKGCTLGRPIHYWALLRAPLKGTAIFGGNTPTSKVVAISIQGGAKTAAGIGIGSTAAAVKHAYPTAHPESSVEPLKFTALRVGSRWWFMLDRKNGHVNSIEIPAPDFCE